MGPNLIVVNGGLDRERIGATAASAGLNVIFYSTAHTEEAAVEEDLVRAGQTRRAQGMLDGSGAHWNSMNRAARRLGLPSAQVLEGACLYELAAARTPHLPFQLIEPPGLDALDGAPFPVWVRGNVAHGFPVSTVVDADEELLLALRMAFRKTDRAIVQPAREGNTIAVFGFKCGRDFIIIEAVGVTMQPKGHRMPLGFTFPAPLDGRAYNACLDLARLAADALPPCHALLEVELMEEDGVLRLADVRVHHKWSSPLRVLFREGMGIDVSVEWMRVLCGQRPRVQARRNVGVAIGWFMCRSGVVQGIKGLEKAGVLPGLVSLAMPAKKGDVVRHCVDLEARNLHGYAVCTGGSRETAVERLRAVHEAIRIDTNPYLD